MLITISRQYAAGGSRVARRVAYTLAWRLVDNDLIDRVAERAEMPSAEVAAREERPPSFVERLARLAALQRPDPLLPVLTSSPALEDSHLVETTGALVNELAAEGRCVIVGRASAAVLARKSETLHIRLIAARELRERHAMDHLGADPEGVADLVEEMDANRARYHREYYRRDWDDPTHYDMVLNTGRLGFRRAAAVIVDQAREMGWS